VHAKTDAEVAAVRPALASGKLTLKTNALATRLLLTKRWPPCERRGVPERRAYRKHHRTSNRALCQRRQFVSVVASLGLRQAPNGVSNSSGVVGRNYMAHNNTALMSIGWKINETKFQKTICINDFYFGDRDFKYPWAIFKVSANCKPECSRPSRNFFPNS
jgi:choline dehydrogenase-like flavoprotein